jgi:hypothetical protein
MKLLFLTFSSTENTHHVSLQLGEKLTERNNQAQHIGINQIIKKLNIGQLSESPIDYKSEESLELKNLKD